MFVFSLNLIPNPSPPQRLRVRGRRELFCLFFCLRFFKQNNKKQTAPFSSSEEKGWG